MYKHFHAKVNIVIKSYLYYMFRSARELTHAYEDRPTVNWQSLDAYSYILLIKGKKDT